MNAEIERLFEAALDIPAAHRAQFLSQHCADAEVRREVELLLEHDHGAEAYLAQAVAGEAASVVRALAFAHGQRLGAYSILSVIGRGGMGTVYLAERADGKFDQRVAIKVVPAGAGGAFAARLQQECRILATLEHPNIARLLDAGATADGLPYFAMEYIAGQPIDRFCDDRKLSARERVQLMLPVCEAVQFAHQKLVVHRDLKPDNILVTAPAIPKLLDFGIAKVLSEAPAAAPATATRILTPEYGSPEQVRGEMAGTTTDIYGLGGVLYKLLTGVAPHRTEGKSPLETVRLICEEDPRPPSSLRPELAGDLDHILQMALRREPQRRYASAEQLAADLRRWLSGDPVLASPDTIWYRSGKFLKRHWLGVTAAAVVLLALTIGVGVATWQARRAERRFAEVRHLANVFLFDFEESIHNVPGATRARQLLVKTALEYLRSLSRDAAGDPVLMRELAAAYEKVGDIQGGPGAGNVGSTVDAVASYRQAIALREALHDAASPDPQVRIAMVSALVKLAGLQSRTKELDAALESCRRAVSLAEATRKANPGERSAEEVLAQAYLQMALLLQRKKDSRASIAEAQRSLTLRQSIAAAPADRHAQMALAEAYRTLGKLTELTEIAPGDTLGYYNKALAILERLSSQDPADGQAERMLINVLSEAGFAAMGTAGDDDAAIRMMRRAYDMANRRVKADPADAEMLSNLFAISVRLAGSLGDRGARTEQGRVLQRALGAATDLVERDPGNLEDLRILASAHDHLGTFFSVQGDIVSALRQRRISAEIWAKLAVQDDTRILYPQVLNWCEMGELLARRHDFQGALAEYALGGPVAERMVPSDPAFGVLLARIRNSVRRARQGIAQYH
jgi:tetratricopeptide (TPR) repeat protein/predicted Ser/Thr protein kinase